MGRLFVKPKNRISGERSREGLAAPNGNRPGLSDHVSRRIEPLKNVASLYGRKRERIRGTKDEILRTGIRQTEPACRERILRRHADKVNFLGVS